LNNRASDGQQPARFHFRRFRAPREINRWLAITAPACSSDASTLPHRSAVPGHHRRLDRVTAQALAGHHVCHATSNTFLTRRPAPVSTAVASRSRTPSPVALWQLSPASMRHSRFNVMGRTPITPNFRSSSSTEESQIDILPCAVGGPTCPKTSSTRSIESSLLPRPRPPHGHLFPPHVAAR